MWSTKVNLRWVSQDVGERWEREVWKQHMVVAVDEPKTSWMHSTWPITCPQKFDASVMGTVPLIVGVADQACEAVSLGM